MCLLSTSVLYAADKLLVSVVGDVGVDTSKIFYRMNRDGRTIDKIFVDKFHEDHFVSRTELSKVTLGGDGVVLKKAREYIVVRIYSDNIDFESGGTIHLDVLYNGITGARNHHVLDCVMELNNRGEMQPVIYYEKKKANKLILKSNKVFAVGVVGIEQIVPEMEGDE